MCWAVAGAEVLRGVVRNGTTKKVSAGDEVILKVAGNNVQDVARTRTNAKGEFSFDAPRASLPYMIAVNHQGVTYTRVAEPGPAPATIQVFDATTDVKNISIQQRM